MQMSADAREWYGMIIGMCVRMADARLPLTSLTLCVRTNERTYTTPVFSVRLMFASSINRQIYVFGFESALFLTLFLLLFLLPLLLFVVTQ